MLATQRTRGGHWGKPYALRGLRQGYCDDPANAAECGWVDIPDQVSGGYCDDPANAAECSWTYDTTPDQTLPTDSGNSQIWAQIIAAAGKIGTQIISAGSTQYRTPYGTYSYGSGPYSALNPTLAQQYLASRVGTFGGLSTTTWLLIGGGLLFAVMMMKR
jgi:hypothetical protein